MSKKKKTEHPAPPADIAAVIDYLGVNETERKIMHRNLVKFLLAIRRWHGETWADIRRHIRFRSGLSFGTMNEYFESLLAEGVVMQNDLHVYYVGVPKKGSKKQRNPLPKTAAEAIVEEEKQ